MNWIILGSSYAINLNMVSDIFIQKCGPRYVLIAQLPKETLQISESFKTEEECFKYMKLILKKSS